MGIHVCVVNVKGKDHPDWDFYRHAGDRDIPSIMAKCGQTRIINFNDDPVYRPLDIEEFRQAMTEAHPENSERWSHLAKLLSESDRWWLYYST